MAPVEQRQGRPERDDLDECEGREDRSRQRQVDEPEDDGDRHEHQRRGDRRPLPDAEVRFVRGIGTDVEDASQLHRTD